MTSAFSAWDAYHATTYRVHTPRGELGIRIGQQLPELDVWLDERGATTWAFVTACNPQSQQLSAAENAQRMRELENWLQAEQRVYFAGEGVGDAGDWPAEASVLVLGMTEAQAVELARRFEQVAIVYGRRAEPARLVRCG